MAAPEPGILQKAWEATTGAVASVGQQASEFGKGVLGDNAVTNGDKLSKVMGAPTVPGENITGGRRYRKKTAKRHSKKRKTMRRRH
jgi:hypothetical protein